MHTRPSDAYVIPFSLMWRGFAIFWEAGVLRMRGPNVGFMSVWGIIISGLFSRTVNSLPLRTLADISLRERSDRRGTI